MPPDNPLLHLLWCEWQHGEPYIITLLCCAWLLSHVQLCDPMDCSLPCPPPGDLPKPGIEPTSPTSQADSLPSEPPGKPTWSYNCTLLLLFSCSVCPTLCNPMDFSTPGFPVLHYLPEFAQTHVYWVDDTIQPSHPLPPPSPPVLNLSWHHGHF